MKALKYRFLTVFAVTFITLFAFSLTVHAQEESNLTVPLAKDYKEAIFYFEFEDEQMHHIEITAPDGSIVTKDSESETVMVRVDSASAGVYKVSITAENDIEVTARVECVNASVSEVNENITVTSQFSGLKIYFVDGNLVVKWDDNGIGKVNISVTNPETMQKLASETIDGTIYSLPLSSTVKEIEVYVVPSSEAKIDGAGITYTVPVIRDVPGTAIMPTETLTNTNDIPFTVNLQEDMWVIINDNGDQVFMEHFEAGEHTINAPLNGVNNDVVVYLCDKDNNMISYNFSITKDIVAPSLTLSEQYHGREVSSETIMVSGYVKNTSVLLINNEEVEFDKSSGRFEYEFVLNMGENEISVCAVDGAGNETVIISDVTRVEPKANPTLIFFGICAVLIVVLFIAVIIKRSGMRKKNVSENEKTEEVEEKSKAPKKKEVSSVSEIKRAENTSDKKKKSYKPYNKKKAEKKKLIVDILASVLVIGCLTIFITKVITISPIMSGSMEPTLVTGSYVIYNNMAYVANNIERGDIILFWSAEEEKYMTKRVIGLPGETITFLNGDVYIDGVIADESAYLAEDIETNCSKEFVVPDNTVFLLGDNREQSLDSRFFINPYIPMEDVLGKYLGTFSYKK